MNFFSTGYKRAAERMELLRKAIASAEAQLIPLMEEMDLEEFWQLFQHDASYAASWVYANWKDDSFDSEIMQQASCNFRCSIRERFRDKLNAAEKRRAITGAELLSAFMTLELTESMLPRPWEVREEQITKFLRIVREAQNAAIEKKLAKEKKP
jgi:hypothetical protein